jgi:hypothetical protein
VAAKSARKAKSSSQQLSTDKDQAKKKARGKRAWKAFGSGSAIIAGLAATKALDATWKTATGRKPPTKPENPDIAGREAILWAALSGMAIGVAKTYATRRAAHYWVRSTGDLPPGMNDNASKADKKRLKKQAAKTG